MAGDCAGIILTEGPEWPPPEKSDPRWREIRRECVRRIHTIMRERFEEVILVSENPLEWLELDGAIVSPLFPGAAPLSDLHAGLFTMTRPFGLFWIWNAPFVSPDILDLLTARMAPGVDAVIPITEEISHPLCAIYGKHCLERITTRLTLGDRHPDPALKKMRVRALPRQQLRTIDPGMRSFFRIHTPSDLIGALKAIPGAAPADTRG